VLDWGTTIGTDDDARPMVPTGFWEQSAAQGSHVLLGLRLVPSRYYSSLGPQTSFKIDFAVPLSCLFSARWTSRSRPVILKYKLFFTVPTVVSSQISQKSAQCRWASVNVVQSLSRSVFVSADAGTRAAASFPAPLFPLGCSSCAALATMFLLTKPNIFSHNRLLAHRSSRADLL
jgi:hypothetical protein